MTASEVTRGNGASPAEPLETLQARVIELERLTRYLMHRVEQSDDAGRPPFGRPDHVSVGEQVSIGRGVVMTADENRPIEIGDRTRILRGAEILGPVKIGARVFLNRDCYVRPQVTIEDGVSVGPFVRFVSDSHEIGPAEHRAGAGLTRPIRVGEGAWIGANVVVLGGVQIGRGAIVAAGAIVTADVPENTVVAGVPARVLRTIENSA